MCAVKRGHHEIVSILVSDSRVPLDISNKSGESPETVTDNREILRLIREGKQRRLK